MFNASGRRGGQKLYGRADSEKQGERKDSSSPTIDRNKSVEEEGGPGSKDMEKPAAIHKNRVPV